MSKDLFTSCAEQLVYVKAITSGQVSSLPSIDQVEHAFRSYVNTQLLVRLGVEASSLKPSYKNESASIEECRKSALRIAELCETIREANKRADVLHEAIGGISKSLHPDSGAYHSAQVNLGSAQTVYTEFVRTMAGAREGTTYLFYSKSALSVPEVVSHLPESAKAAAINGGLMSRFTTPAHG